MILGAQKCATTTLFDMLTRADIIAKVALKEPHFFSTTEDWARNIEDYHMIFDRRSTSIFCEASTSYTFFPHRKDRIWDDIHAYNPEMKMIYLVRNPVDRITSQYKHVVSRGYYSGSLESFITESPLPIDISRYHTQIRPYIDRFGRDRVLILDFSDFIERRESTLQEIADFLDVDFRVLRDVGPVHSNDMSSARGHYRFDRPGLFLRMARKASPGTWRAIVRRFSPSPPLAAEMSADRKRLILEVLEPEIAGMEGLMGKDLSEWRTGKAT